MDFVYADFVIIGGGLAGSAAACRLSTLGDVALLSKPPTEGSNSHAAQGGIAAAVGPDDAPVLHARDTTAAGAGLCHVDAVQVLTDAAPSLIHWLQEMGVRFDCDAHNHLSLGLEGAHGRRRILHAGGDCTGYKVMAALQTMLGQCPNIERFPHAQAFQLVKNAEGRVIGVRGVRGPAATHVTTWVARRAVVLATGGAGQLFQRTTNPVGATGDGIVLAYEAGAIVRNLEFVQFHPTAIALDANPCFLVSEAVRGAGARLTDAAGRPIMSDPADDLASRDVVARAIYRQQSDGIPVYLDTTTLPDFANRFPTIYAHCMNLGMDATSQPIPVSPAAHFMMGGVAATMYGETNVPGLYALGEVACTGVHGANRLASNSLLECLVMAFEFARHLEHNRQSPPSDLSIVSDAMPEPDGVNREEVLAAVREILWKYAGIIRNGADMESGRNALLELPQHNPMVTTARLILTSALARRETRGAHYRVDFPETKSDWNRDTELSKGDGIRHDNRN